MNNGISYKTTLKNKKMDDFFVEEEIKEDNPPEEK